MMERSEKREIRNIAFTLIDQSMSAMACYQQESLEIAQFRHKLYGVHTLAIVVGAALMATGIGHLFASTLQLLELQSELNEHLPQADKFEPLFWSLPQFTQLRRLQRDLLPRSPRMVKVRRFGLIGLSVLFSGVALLFFGLSKP
jgi:hypothetical protein